MAIDLKHRNGAAEPDDNLNPGQNHADEEFARLTHPDHMAKDATPGELNNAETAAPLSSPASFDTWNNKNTNSSSLAAAEGLAAGGNFAFNPAEGAKGSRLKNLVRNTSTRNKGIAGGLIGLLLGGGIFLGIPALGPFELIHLGQVLDHSFSKVQSDSSDRTGHLFRFARAWQNKNVGYTRLGTMGTKIMNSTLDDLAKAGFTIEETNSANRPTDIGIESSRIKDNFPEAKGMSDQQFREFTAQKLGVPYQSLQPDIVQGGKVVKWKMDIRSFKFQSINNLIRNGQIGLVGDGRIIASLKTRVIGKFFGLGSLFHPFSRALAQQLNQKVTAATDQKKSAQEEEKKFTEEQQAKRTFAVDSKGDVVAKTVKEKVDGQKGLRTKAIAIAGVVIAGACIAHETASEIPKLDYYRVVAPSEIQATSIESQASQTQYGGPDTTANQVGATVEGLTDASGNTVWQSAGINALEGNKVVTDSAGNYQYDLPPQYRQAYEEHSTARIIDEASTALLDSMVGPLGLLHFAGVDPGIALCNSAVQYSLAAVSIIAQGVADFFSGGGAQVAIGAAETGESLLMQKYVVGSAIEWVQKWFVNSSTGGKLAEDAFSGPLGGNLLAFGARSTANVVAIGSGGVSTGNPNSTFVSALDQSEQQEFRSENLFARMFDLNDYRSLAGRLADGIRPSLYGNLSLLGESMLHIGSSLSNALGSLLPHAAATSNSWSGDFNWGFPQYGIPDNMLNDPSLADPYANANDVGKYLDSACKDASGTIGSGNGSCGGSHGLTARILGCFGNNLTYSSGAWDVAPVSNVEINPNDSPYVNDNCNDIQNQTWRRIVMFINDTSTMKAIACYQGDDSSCSDLGMDSTATPPSGSAAGGTIDTSTLYQSSVDVPCANGTNDLGNATGYTNGTAVQIRLCAIPGLPSTGAESNGGYGVSGAHGLAVVNSRVSGNVLAMVQAAASSGVHLTAISSFRSMAHQESLCPCDGVKVAHPGYSNHQMGLAIDFGGGLPSTPGPIADNKFWEWLSQNAAKFGYKNYPREAWHWSPTGN